MKPAARAGRRTVGRRKLRLNTSGTSGSRRAGASARYARPSTEGPVRLSRTRRTGGLPRSGARQSAGSARACRRVLGDLA